MKLQKRRYGKKKKAKVPMILFIIFLMVGTALAIAWVWQKTENKAISSASESSLQESSSLINPNSQSSISVSSESPTSSDPESSEESDESSGEIFNGTYTAREDFSYAVKESGEPVDSSYFKDAIFFGDSISTGIPPYLGTMLKDVPVVAAQGVDPYNVMTNEIFTVDGKDVTLLEAAKQYGDKKKVYILMGSNGLGYEKDVFEKGYREFLEAVKEQYPDAIIYVQSMTPVTKKAKDKYNNFGSGNANEAINEYNMIIMGIAKDLGVQYLDIAAAMVDKKGELPVDASPSDGVHFKPEYYYIWYEYLLKHTVKGDK